MRVVAALALILIQDKAAISFKPAQGETLKTTDTITITGKAKLVVNGVADEMGLQQMRRRAYSVEFAEVADGAVRRKVLKFDEDATRTRENEKDEWETVEQPLHGRTVTVRVRDGKTEIEGIDKPDEDTKRHLTVDEPEAGWWPSDAVAVGGTWESARGGIIERLLDLSETTSKLTFTLKDLKAGAAVIGVKGAVSGKSPNGTNYDVTLEGEMTASVERGVVLSMKLAGKVKLQRRSDTIAVDAEGTVVVERAATFK